jgi:hypothetical protein
MEKLLRILKTYRKSVKRYYAYNWKSAKESVERDMLIESIAEIDKIPFTSQASPNILDGGIYLAGHIPSYTVNNRKIDPKHRIRTSVITQIDTDSDVGRYFRGCYDRYGPRFFRIKGSLRI